MKTMLAFVAGALAVAAVVTPTVQPAPVVQPPVQPVTPVLRQNEQKGDLKVAVVNLRDCFDKAKIYKVKDLEETLEKQQKALVDDLEARAKVIREIEAQMKTLAPDSPLYQELRSQRALKLGEAEARKKLGELEIKEKQRAFRLKIYQDILDACKFIAQERGIDLVLKIDAPSSEEEEERSGIELRILYRQILFSSDRLDITVDVVKKMNAEYEKIKAGQAKQYWCPQHGNTQAQPGKCATCQKDLQEKK